MKVRPAKNDGFSLFCCALCRWSSNVVPACKLVHCLIAVFQTAAKLTAHGFTDIGSAMKDGMSNFGDEAKGLFGCLPPCVFYCSQRQLFCVLPSIVFVRACLTCTPSPGPHSSRMKLTVRLLQAAPARSPASNRRSVEVFSM